jgi:hypothetical protein
MPPPEEVVEVTSRPRRSCGGWATPNGPTAGPLLILQTCSFLHRFTEHFPTRLALRRQLMQPNSLASLHEMRQGHIPSLNEYA